MNWWTKAFPTQKVTPTGKYTNAGLSVAYTSGGSAGDTLYIKMASRMRRTSVLGILS